MKEYVEKHIQAIRWLGFTPVAFFLWIIGMFFEDKTIIVKLEFIAVIFQFTSIYLIQRYSKFILPWKS